VKLQSVIERFTLVLLWACALVAILGIGLLAWLVL
jgi:hypothetical protein